MLDDYIESVTDDRTPDGFYHPSSMYGCDRKTIYEARGEPVTDPPDAQAKRRFYIGHRLHEAVQRTLESHPKIKEFYPEAMVQSISLNIQGHTDGILLDENDEWWLVEAKSIRKGAVRMGLPKEDHVKQAATYWWLASRMGFWYDEIMPGISDEGEPSAKLHDAVDLKGIIMVYVEKEDLNVYEYVLEPEPWWTTIAPETSSRLDEYLIDPNSLPKRLPLNKNGTRNWLCGYCQFATKCWTVDPAHVEPEGDTF